MLNTTIFGYLSQVDFSFEPDPATGETVESNRNEGVPGAVGRNLAGFIYSSKTFQSSVPASPVPQSLHDTQVKIYPGMVELLSLIHISEPTRPY